MCFELDNFVETSGAQGLILLAGRVAREFSCQYAAAAREPGTFTLTAGRAELAAQKKA